MERLSSLLPLTSGSPFDPCAVEEVSVHRVMHCDKLWADTRMGSVLISVIKVLHGSWILASLLGLGSRALPIPACSFLGHVQHNAALIHHNSQRVLFSGSGTQNIRVEWESRKSIIWCLRHLSNSPRGTSSSDPWLQWHLMTRARAHGCWGPRALAVVTEGRAPKQWPIPLSHSPLPEKWVSCPRIISQVIYCSYTRLKTTWSWAVPNLVQSKGTRPWPVYPHPDPSPAAWGSARDGMYLYSLNLYIN